MVFAAAAARPRLAYNMTRYLPPKSTGVIALAIGAAALGALAVGSMAIGYAAIGKLAVKRARIGKLEIDELVVRRLTRPDVTGL